MCVWIRAIKVALTKDKYRDRVNAKTEIERERKRERGREGECDDLRATFFSPGIIEIDVLCN